MRRLNSFVTWRHVHNQPSYLGMYTLTSRTRGSGIPRYASALSFGYALGECLNSWLSVFSCVNGKPLIGVGLSATRRCYSYLGARERMRR